MRALFGGESSTRGIEKLRRRGVRNGARARARRGLDSSGGRRITGRSICAFFLTGASFSDAGWLGFGVEWR